MDKTRSSTARVAACSFVAAALLCASQATSADTVHTVWHVEGLTQYDYVSGQWVTPTVPTAFDVTIDFPSNVTNVENDALSTITYFGKVGATRISSPLTQYVGADPYGSGLPPKNAATFPNVGDYASAFLEAFAAQADASSHSYTDGRDWSYVIGLYAIRLSPSRGGTGTAVYAFTTQSLLDFLKDVEAFPEKYAFSFGEIWDVIDDTSLQYLAGTGWHSYNGHLVSYSVIKDNDPATMLKQLLDEVTGVGPGKSLADKASLAMTYYAVPDIQATCAVLTDFVSEVRAQTGKKLPTAQAAKFASDAQAIMAAIGCK